MESNQTNHIFTHIDLYCFQHSFYVLTIWKLTYHLLLQFDKKYDILHTRFPIRYLGSSGHTYQTSVWHDSRGFCLVYAFLCSYSLRNSILARGIECTYISRQFLVLSLIFIIFQFPFRDYTCILTHLVIISLSFTRVVFWNFLYKIDGWGWW